MDEFVSAPAESFFLAGELLDAMPDGYLSLGSDGRISFLNAAGERLIGIGRHEIQTEAGEGVLGSAVGEELPRACQRVLANGDAESFEAFSTSRGKWFEGRIAPSVDGLHVFFRDITDHKRTEAELAAGRQMLRDAIRAGRVLPWHWDVATDTVTWPEGLPDDLATALPAGAPVTLRAFLDLVHPDDRERLSSMLRIILDAKSPNGKSLAGSDMRERSDVYEAEFRLVTPDGGVRWRADKGRVIRDAAGRVVRMTGVAADVTDYKRAQALAAAQAAVLERIARGEGLSEVLTAVAELIRSDSPGFAAGVLELDARTGRLRPTAVANIPESYVRGIGEGREVGPECGSCGTAAYTRRRVVVADIASDRKWTGRMRDAALAQGYRACWSTPVFGAGGEVLGTLAVYSPVPRSPDAADERLMDTAAHLAGIAIARHRAAEDARASEQQFRVLAESIPHTLWTARPDGTVDYFSPSGLAFSGVTIEQVRAGEYDRYIHPGDLPILMRQWARMRATGEGGEGQMRIRRSSDNTYRWHLGRVVAVKDRDGRVVRWVGTNTDIHDQKRAGELARESEERYRALAEAMPAFVWTARPDGRIDYVNGRFLKYTGACNSFTSCTGASSRAGAAGSLRGSEGAEAPVRESEVREIEWESFVHPDDREAAGEKWFRAMMTGSAAEVECRLRSSDGAYRWFLTRIVPVHGPDGAVVRWIGTHTDIDGQKRVEGTIIASEERYRTLAEAMPQIVWTSDAAGQVEYYNRLGREYLGVSEGLVIGADWGARVHPDDVVNARDGWARARRTGETVVSEVRLKRASDGAYHWHLCRTVPVRDEAGRVVRWVGTCTDIDEQRRAVQENAGNFAAAAAATAATEFKESATASSEFPPRGVPPPSSQGTSVIT